MDLLTDTIVIAKLAEEREDENDAFDGLDADDDSDAEDENNADFEDEFGGLEGMSDEDHEHMPGDEEDMDMDMFGDEPGLEDLDLPQDGDDGMMMEESSTTLAINSSSSACSRSSARDFLEPERRAAQAFQIAGFYRKRRDRCRYRRALDRSVKGYRKRCDGNPWNRDRRRRHY